MTTPPPILGSPTEADRAAANVTCCPSWLRDEYGLQFSEYEPLWRWSVHELETFWE